MPDTVTIILPVFALIGVGLLLRLVGVADESWVNVLNRYGMYVGFPVLVFVNLSSVRLADVTSRLDVFAVSAVLIVGMFVVMSVVAAALRLPRAWANTLVLCSFFGNVAYLGFPIVTALVPNREKEVTILIATYVLVLFTAGIVRLERSTSERVSNAVLVVRIIKNPFILAILAAVVVLVVGVTLPQWFLTALNMIKASASPVVLVALGVFLGTRRDWRLVWRRAALLLAIKMFVFPALFVIAGALFVSPTMLLPSVLEAAMPVGVTIFALSAVYPLERETTAAVVVAGTALAAVTLPCIAWCWPV